MHFPLSSLTAEIFAPADLLVVIGIAVLLFGGKKIPELAKGLGEGIKNFKNAVKEDEHPTIAETKASATPSE